MVAALQFFELLALAACAALPNAGTLSVSVTVERTDKPRFGRHRKRETVDLELKNLFTYYSADLEIGTPKQQGTFLIDTGSSDLWVSSSDFSTSSSSTYQETSYDFAIAYADQSSASGKYATDNVYISGAQVSGANFAVATSDSDGTNVFGVGPRNQEASVNTLSQSGTLSRTYDNIPIQLKNQGFISSTSYSLWLDAIDDTTGQILFGGVDHAKYIGNLAVVPVLRRTIQGIQVTEPMMLSVVLNGISVYNGNGDSGDVVSGASLSVLLDSGTSLTYLPGDWVDAIGNTIKATYNSGVNGYITGKISGGLKYSLSGIEIDVPFDQILLDLTTGGGGAASDDDGNSLYMLGISPEGTGVDYSSYTYILGDTFLRSAYVVYDLDNWEIALAPLDSDPSGSNVEAIVDSIPSATQAPGYSATETGTSYSTNEPALF